MNESKYQNIVTYDTPAYQKRKHRHGDRKDGRRIRSLPAMNFMIPFIMPERNDALNMFEDVVDISAIERYLDQKHKEGYGDMTVLHIVLAAYCRVVAERPGVNRFVSGQRIFARPNILCNMDIKKEFTLEGEGTCIKVELDPRDNIENVYKKFQTEAIRAINETTDFDSTARTLIKMPRFLLRFAIRFLKFLDYYNLLPRKLLEVSPFHGSLFVTHLGSIGIPAVYHHIYNFGNVPVFVAIGNMFSGEVTRRDGVKENHHFITMKIVTDERICDGYYFASAFKRIKRYLLHPEMLDQIRTEVTEDVD